MKLTYDPKYNVAYIRLRKKEGPVETIHLSEAINVDIAPDGTIYGLEFLNANEQLREPDSGRLVVELAGCGTVGVVNLQPASP